MKNYKEFFYRCTDNICMFWMIKLNAGFMVMGIPNHITVNKSDDII